MGGDSTVLGVIIAVVGVVGSVLVARISTPRSPTPRPDAPPAALPPGEGLSVSPEIWRSLSGRISELETKVAGLTEAVSKQTERVTFLERLLRTAMRIIRQQQRTLRRAGLPDEEIPRVLLPYSID